jgi:hypothetical protein
MAGSPAAARRGWPRGAAPARCAASRPGWPGDLLGHIWLDQKVVDPAALAKIEMELTFASDIGYADNFLRAVTSWRDNLTAWILPRIFAVADGNPPPVMTVRS